MFAGAEIFGIPVFIIFAIIWIIANAIDEFNENNNQEPVSNKQLNSDHDSDDSEGEPDFEYESNSILCPKKYISDEDIKNFFVGLSNYQFDGLDEDDDLCFSLEVERCTIEVIVAMSEGDDEREAWLIWKFFTTYYVTDKIEKTLGDGAEKDSQLFSEYITSLNDDQQLQESQTDCCLAELGLETQASWQEVQLAYRDICKKYHPDVLASHDIPEHIKALSEAKFKSATEAYNQLRTKYYD